MSVSLASRQQSAVEALSCQGMPVRRTPRTAPGLRSICNLRVWQSWIRQVRVVESVDGEAVTAAIHARLPIEALRLLRLFNSSSTSRHEHDQMHPFGLDVWMFACCGSILRGPLLRTPIPLDPESN